MNRYEISTPRAACRFAAIAMTIITIGVMVVLPAKIEPANREARALPESKAVAMAPAEGANGAAGRVPRMIARESRARASTRAH